MGSQVVPCDVAHTSLNACPLYMTFISLNAGCTIDMSAIPIVSLY